MSNIPKISVVLAVYNGEKYIKPSIESILAQTYKDFELIIVNDASTDSTLNIISSYNDSRIIIHNNNQNIGQTASLNAGLRVARGKYIARTDAGDISMPERFLKQVQYLDNHANIDILGSAAYQYDIKGNFCGNVFMPNRPSTILQRIFFACPVIHISVMMHRERILRLGGYNESYRILADYGLWAKALQNGYRFWNLSEVLAGYLVTPDSFGYSNSRDRSVKEAANIICDIALSMTGIKLSLDQAEDLYRFFVFGPHDIDGERMFKAEALFETLLLKLRIPRRDIDYLLMKNYLKALIGKKLLNPSRNHLSKDVPRRVFAKLRGGMSSHLFEDLYRSILSISHRSSAAKGKAMIEKSIIKI